MNAPGDILGPELEGLLREAAADPRSQLLRVPRPARVAGLHERGEVLRATAHDMTALERHLIAVHRAELADVLLRACAIRTFEDPQVRLRVHRCKDAEEDRELETWDRLAEGARTCLDATNDPAGGEDALVLVRALACDSRSPASTSITQLARAAHRLEPSSQATAWIGFDQALHGQDASAVRLLGELLQVCPKHHVASASLGNLGMAYSNLGRLDEAARSYRKAFERDHGRTTALVGWLHYAVQSGDLEESRAARRTLDEVVRDPRASFLELLDSYEQRKRQGTLSISAAGRRTAERLASEAGTVSGKVIDVYL